MNTEKPVLEGSRPQRLFLPALAIAVFSAGISNSVITLLVVDIARTFFGSPDPAAIAAVSQLTTFNAAAEIAFAVLLSILVVRIRHKPLLMAGVLLVVASAIGSFFAPTLLSLEFFLAIEGGGSIIVTIIALTLIGDFLPPQKKAKAISYLISVSYLATLILILLIGFIASIGGWRYDFLLIALPISAAGLILASLVVPSRSHDKPATKTEKFSLRIFKTIFTDRSATASLIASILTVAGTQVAVFAIAFYQIQFAASRTQIIGIYETAVILFIVAPLVSGPIIHKYGAKRVAVSSTLLAAFFTLAFFFIPDLWAAIIFDMLHVWFAAFAAPAFVYLILEQIPKSRGTMMSLNAIFNNIGNAIAPALGGALLFLTSGFYGVVGLAFGSITIAGAVILIFLVKDTTKTTV